MKHNILSQLQNITRRIYLSIDPSGGNCLTNIDYRIIASVLSERLQNVIGDIVSPDQTAYIKGRFIGTNIRLVQDVFDLYNSSNYAGVLLFVDF